MNTQKPTCFHNPDTIFLHPIPCRVGIWHTAYTRCVCPGDIVTCLSSGPDSVTPIDKGADTGQVYSYGGLVAPL